MLLRMETILLVRCVFRIYGTEARRSSWASIAFALVVTNRASTVRRREAFDVNLAHAVEAGTLIRVHEARYVASGIFAGIAARERGDSDSEQSRCKQGFFESISSCRGFMLGAQCTGGILRRVRRHFNSFAAVPQVRSTCVE